MLRYTLAAVVVLALTLGTAAADVVINEIYVDSAGTYDGAEFIELYNDSATPVSLDGYVLAGPEYEQLCGGEDRWQFPAGTTIGAYEYIVVTKDAHDGDDGFFEEFGIEADFEMFDPSFFADHDYLFVPNMVLLDDDPGTGFSDEIQLVGGRGYGIMCGTTSHADVVYLYTTASLTTLVDLVEYMDPNYCTTDPCFGDDGLVDNAFEGVPFLGNSLGRDATSADTDNSNVDWSLQAPTPGAVNVENTPPWISTVRYAPIPPTSLDNVEISATVTDNGTIDSVNVYYNMETTGSGWAMAPASAVGDVYTAQLPLMPDGEQVAYFVRAIDDNGAKLSYPAEGFTGPYHFSVGYTTIYDIQYVDEGLTDSPKMGQSVNVTGIVTAGVGDFSTSFCMIQEGNGPFEGIKVFNTYDVPIDVNVGDEITACGIVTEYYGETELYLHFDEALVVHSTGNATSYASVTTGDLYPEPTGTPEYLAEPWEGQIVSVTNVTVTAEPDGYGQWYIDDGTGGAQVDDYGYYSYVPVLFDVLDEVRGVFMYSYDQYKIEPVTDDDIIGPPRIDTVRYTPIPPAAGNVTITADISDNQGINSATLIYKERASGTWSQTPMTTSREGYSASVGPWADGDEVMYYIEASDGAMTSRKPAVGSYSLYIGMETIQDIQYVLDPDVSDVSPYDTLAVNTTGIVTAEPGIYSDYYFTIQTSGGGCWDGIKVYDRTGSVTFERGDEIIVCGEVQENWGETELALHFADAAVLVSSKAADPTPLSVNTADLQAKSTAECLEGVLVYAEDATVEVEDLGFGEWAITNGAAGDTCRVDDDAVYTYDPVQGDNVYVLGTVMYLYGNYKLEPRGDEDIAVNPVGVDNPVASKLGLAQNMPNPFNPKTTIAFTLPVPQDVTIDVFDIAGRKVVTLLDDNLGAGQHFVEWAGRDADGQRVASGIYFYRMNAGEEQFSRKMVLLK